MKESLLDVINYVNEKTNTSKFKIWMDILACKKKYGFTPYEYKVMHLYEVEDSIKETLLSNKVNQELINKYNSKEDKTFLKTNSAFHKKMNRFIEPSWMELTGNNITDFHDFMKDKKYFNAFLETRTAREGVTKKVDLKNYTSLYNDLVLSKKTFIKDIEKECPETKCLNEEEPNTIVFLLVNGSIEFAYLKTKIHQKYSKFLYAPINLETGIIDYPAYDVNGQTYETHPLSGKEILWTQLPRWPRTKRLAIKVAEFLKEDHYLEVELHLNEEGPTLENVSIEPNYLPLQMIHLKGDHKGIKDSIIEKLEQKGE